MLTAQMNVDFLGARFFSGFAMHPRVRVNFVERTGIVFDTKLNPPARTTSERVLLYLVVSGTLEFAGAVHSAPCIVCVHEDAFESRTAPLLQLRSYGKPLRSVDVLLRADDVTMPRGVVLALDSALAEQLSIEFERIVSTSSTQTAQSIEQSSCAATDRALRLLRDAGIVATTFNQFSASEPSPAVRTLWRVLGPLYGRGEASATLKQIAGALSKSPRQTIRAIHELLSVYPVPGLNFRAAVQLQRLRMAAMLLSADGATPAAVAQKVGYAHTAALDRAFRDAGMLSPTELQMHLRTGLANSGAAIALPQ